jgi:acyl-CoA thioesterase FadM
MYYSTHYTTKWHDTDGDGVMRPSALLVYMQETANLQCREYGMDLTDLHHKEGKGFLLSRMMVKVFAPLRAYEDIEVRTWCIDSKGYNFIRCFSVHRGDDMMALAVSHWALVDVHEKKMLRTTDFRRDFPYGELPDESLLPKRVRIPAALEMEDVGRRAIVYSDLDFNRHMNNTRYPDMICDYLPDMDGRWVSSLSLSYLREAAFGDVLTVRRAAALGDGETYLLRTNRPDGLVCLEAEIGLSKIG